MPFHFTSAVAYTYRDQFIPQAVAEELDRWTQDGALPGPFLQAVLSNDLRMSFGRADERSRAALHCIVVYLYNEAPGGSWGSPACLTEWPRIRAERAASTIATPKA